MFLFHRDNESPELLELAQINNIPTWERNSGACFYRIIYTAGGKIHLGYLSRPD